MKSIRNPLAALLASGLLSTSMHAQSSSSEARKPPLPQRAQPPQTMTIGAPPSEWGTTARSWYRLGASELSPDTSGTTYTSLWNPDLLGYTYARYVTGGFPHLVGFAHLPGGSVFDAFQFTFCDNSSAAPHMTISLYSCDTSGACISPPVYSFDTGTLDPNCWSTAVTGAPFGFTVDNQNTEYMVDVVFGQMDSSQTISSVAFGYHLQVSPAPGSPSFNDVPPSDPAFQYIEALVASGITAGCGGGSYCPDTPVTRRQMAVFIAKALGLNWPDY